MKLDKQSWQTLHDICKGESTSVCNLLSMIDDNRGDIGLSLATRVFLISYLRNTIADLQIKNPKKKEFQKPLLDLISVIYKKEV